jgi:TRAP-type mannitol/chloroaromatic compound transport system substrate-binding protein
MKSTVTRRNFIEKAGILAGATVLGSSCAQPEVAKSESSQQSFTWRLATTWPPSFPILGEGVSKMAEWVNIASSGRLNIKVFGANELVPPLEVFDAVSLQGIEMGHGAAYYWSGKMPAASFFASVPFGMSAQQMNAWLVAGGGQQLWNELYENHGVVPFPAGNTGVQMGGWFNKEINSVADLNGLIMRMPGLGGKVLGKLGAASVTIPGSEVYTSLERGVIDATEWIGPYHDYKLGLNKVGKYYYYPGWHEPGSNLEMIINSKALATLPADLKEILTSAIYRLNHWMLCESDVQNALFLKKMISEKVILKRFPDDVLQKLKDATDETLQELAKADSFAAKIYDSYRQFRSDMKNWTAISEKEVISF